MQSLHPRPILLLLLAPACNDRAQPHSDLGRRFALHLCPGQTACDCEEELLIPDCEARVERELFKAERRALDAGLEIDEACVDRMLARIDGFAGTCDLDLGDPASYCSVYTAEADVGEACKNYEYVPWMTECRAGLQCIQGICRDSDKPLQGRRSLLGHPSYPPHRGPWDLH